VVCARQNGFDFGACGLTHLPSLDVGENATKRVFAWEPKSQLAMSSTCLQPQQCGDQCVDLFARVIERQ